MLTSKDIVPNKYNVNYLTHQIIQCSLPLLQSVLPDNIFKPHSQCLTRSNFFSNHVINDWNSLPTNIVNATSINNFISLLDEHWQNSL